MFVDIDTVAGHFDLFGNLIDTFIFSVDEEFGKAYRCREGNAHPLGGDGGIDVHHVRHVAIVGEQHPVFVFLDTEHLRREVELDAVGLLVIPIPGRVATSTDASRTRHVRIFAHAVDRNVAIHIVLFRDDGLLVGRRHVDGKALVLVLTPSRQRRRERDAVEPSVVFSHVRVAEGEGRNDFVLILATVHEEGVVAIEVEVRHVVHLVGESPVVVGVVHMELIPVLCLHAHATAQGNGCQDS